MRLPPGYRFFPTDYELIKHHLLNKIATNQNLIAEINDVELYNYHPQMLADTYPNLDNKWYFFSPRDRKYPNGSRPSRSTRNGYWKATGSSYEVYGREGEGIVGHKRTLAYYTGAYKKGDKTNWIMHEYWVDHPPRTKTHANDMKLDDWVLCRIYKKASRLPEGYNEQQESNSGEPNINAGGEVEQASTSNGGGREREQASTSSSNGVARERMEEELDGYFNIMMEEDWNGSSNYWSTVLHDNCLPSGSACLSKEGPGL